MKNIYRKNGKAIKWKDTPSGKRQQKKDLLKHLFGIAIPAICIVSQSAAVINQIRQKQAARPEEKIKKSLAIANTIIDMNCSLIKLNTNYRG